MASTPITVTEVLTSCNPAPKLFQAFVIDADHLLPKIVPQAIKSIQTLKGDGGIGTIKQINFAEGTPFKYAKNKVDALDKQNLTYKYTTIEGDTLMGKLEKISHDVKVESTADGKSKVNIITKYFPKAGVHANEEEFKDAREKAKAVFDAVDAYLVANP